MTPDASSQRTRRGLEEIAEDLARHRRLVGDGNAVYSRLLLELESVLCGDTADSAIVEHLLRVWQDREFLAYYERPLLLQAALRFDALSSPVGHPLAAALRSHDPDARAVSRQTVLDAMHRDRLVLWLALATRKVQTNDVSRAVAWLWPATLVGPRPIILVDVGCSAGLNLVADQLSLRWTRADGSPLTLGRPTVLQRIGFDRDPIDVTDDDEARWLRACIWPGDHDRLQRLDDAVAVFRGQAQPPRIERVSARHAVGRLRKIVATAPPDALVVVFQSFVRDYLVASEREAFAEDLANWLADVPRGRAVVIELELANDRRTPPAELVARPSRHPALLLARCSYHPGALEINAPEVPRLRDALTP